jgi:hypothetical protein
VRRRPSAGAKSIVYRHFFPFFGKISNFPCNNPPDLTQYNCGSPNSASKFTLNRRKGYHVMFQIEEGEKNQKTGVLVSSFAAHTLYEKEIHVAL